MMIALGVLVYIVIAWCTAVMSYTGLNVHDRNERWYLLVGGLWPLSLICMIGYRGGVWLDSSIRKQGERWSS